MISILIPVFNVNVYSLVQELSKQLENLGVDGELLVYDDFSEAVYKIQNQAVRSFSKVVYKELDKNYGRTNIRQILAKEAKNEWLLFIDSDSAIVNDNYLNQYLLVVNGQCDVYSGGRIYTSKEPADCNKRLHWKYGRERESIKGSRNALHSNNFCIKRQLFLDLNFPNQLCGYGHEDTWMEMALTSKQKKIGFIENPVLHEGLEDAAVFLEKTKSALNNLLLLPDFFNEKQVRKKVGLFNLFYLQHKLGLTGLTLSVLKKRIGAIEANLISCNPSLFNFDLYRLFHLIQSQTILKSSGQH